MNKTTAALSSLALAALLPAQPPKPIASPVGLGLETNEGFGQLAPGWGGASFTFYFGAYSNERIQYLMGGLADNKLKLITQIGFRMDHRNHTTTSAMGRKWTRVDLSMSELPYASFANNFGSNSVSPQQVFSSPVSWPSQTGTPSTKPAPWGTPGLTFPFKGLWPYTAKNAIVADFTFLNGTMNNAAPWSGSKTQISYYLDGVFIAYSVGYGFPRHPRTPPVCADSGFTPSTTIYAQDNSYLNAYSKAYTNPTQAGQWEYNLRSRYTAKGKPLIHALGLGKAMNPGVNVFAACNMLYVDFTQPVILLGRTANNDATASTPTLPIRFPRTAATFNLTATTQVACTDSVTGQFSLTTAAEPLL
ncbi:MAG: hypothetical protein ACYTGO_14350, partial [Planctomycetota bacterium]